MTVHCRVLLASDVHPVTCRYPSTLGYADVVRYLDLFHPRDFVLMRNITIDHLPKDITSDWRGVHKLSE